MRPRALVVPLVVALAACGSDDGDDPAAGTVAPVTESDEAAATTPPPPDPTEPPAPEATAPPPTFTATPLVPDTSVGGGTAPGFPLDPGLPLVTAAVDDLAAHLGIEPSAVTVVDARAVTWGDSSLGCPEPGMNYLQRLVDGTLVVLKAGGSVYEYHGGDPLFRCDNPRPPSGS